MSRFVLAMAAVIAISVAGISIASGEGYRASDCGVIKATNAGGDYGTLSLKSYDIGCAGARNVSLKFFSKVNGEQGKPLGVNGFKCGPLQAYKPNGLAFNCRKKNAPSKRVKAHWVTKKA